MLFQFCSPCGDRTHKNTGHLRKASLESVRYAADRADDKVRFTEEAPETILNVPRVFLPLVLKGCVEWARENHVERITAEHMQIINDKRAKEKNK